MDDLISRQAAIEIIQSMYPGMPKVPWRTKDWEKQYEPYIRVEEEIKRLPPAQPERKKGRWIAHGIEEGNAFAVYTCSECGVLVGINTSNFCPNCGAEMEKGES